MENIQIFVATHKKFKQELPDFYKPILVGSKDKDINEYIRDDSGEDQISEKNPNYCELTGIYWIWKNISNIENIGLCHYRRYFIDKNKKVLNKEKILKVLKSNDIILPRKWYTKDTVYEYYRKKHNIEDLNNCKIIIEKKYPQYLQSFEKVMNDHGMYTCNMFIMRKELFNDYCKWLFDILDSLEKITDISKYDDYQKRIYGFLSERLFNVWISKSNLKIHEEKIWLTQNTTKQEAKRNFDEHIRRILYK